jgi:DNA-binding PadR family transcriptional regulator
LVRNERKVLAAALRLAWEGSADLYGYELFARLRDWEGEAAMDHGTLYRCLRALEGRGFFGTSTDQSSGRLRVNYRLSEAGTTAARQAAIELAAEEHPPSWVDLGALFGGQPHRTLPA